MRIPFVRKKSATFDATRSFELAGRHIDPQVRKVAWNNKEQKLEPKSVELLLTLIAAGLRPVSRAEIVDNVWQGSVISDDALQRAVAKLRRALGDNSKNPEIIGTLPKTGYRLLVEPEQFESVDVSMRSLGSAAAAMGVLVMAVIFNFQPTPSAVAYNYSAARPLTSSPGYELAPALSAQGDYLAYVTYDDTKADPSLDLFLMDRRTGEREMLSGGPGVQAWPTWSPIGNSLIYIDGDQESCHIKLFSLPAKEARSVSPCGSPNRVEVAWDSDGQSIYILDAASLEAPKTLTKLSLLDGAREEVSLDVANVKQMTLSPDGKALALVRQKYFGQRDIYLYDVETRRERRVTNQSQNIDGVSWSADGASLIIASNRAGMFRLWDLRISDGYLSAILVPGMNLSYPEIATSPGPLIYQVWDAEVNLQLVGGDGDVDTRIAKSSRWEWSPSPSPDGNEVAFLTNRRGTTDLWVANADGSQARAIAKFDASFDSLLSWAPGKKKIVFSVVEDDVSFLSIVDVESGALTEIKEAGVNLRDPIYSSDGEKIYYASDADGAWTIRERHLRDNRERLIGPGRLARLSPDGAFLYIGGENGSLDIINVQSEERKNALSDYPVFARRAWAPTKDGVVFLDGAFDAGYRLMSWQRETGKVFPYAQIDGNILESSALAQHPDGRFWITRIDYCGSDLWEAPLAGVSNSTSS